MENLLQTAQPEPHGSAPAHPRPPRTVSR
uniref:Uncharacterized protein n=1 Tax=Anguilla anguilla TaxID=7936 RepID=A0A0E9UX12_ANGAN